MLSRRVIAYYGLMRASESLPAAYGFAAGAAAPKENGLRWESRGSPIYSAGLCSRAASHTPATRRVRLTVSSSSVLAFTPVSRVRRHIGSFEAAEFTHSQVHRNCYGPRAGLPSFRGRLHSSLRRPGRPQSASNMTTWVNSQFPRPDFHRQVQRHYGLQTVVSSPVRPRQLGTGAADPPGVGKPGLRPAVTTETTGSLRFPSDPHVPTPCSWTPVGPKYARPLRRLGTAPACVNNGGSREQKISGLDRTALGLAVYASQWRSPATTQDSLPAAGQALQDGIR